MSENSGRRPDHGPDIGRDPALSEALRSLDPAGSDTTYWFRFHHRVMEMARGELARRRMMAEVTVGDVVASWGRALVPGAALAAMIAAFLMLQARAVPVQTPVAVEDLLAEGLDAPIPTVLTEERTSGSGAVVFASDVF